MFWLLLIGALTFEERVVQLASISSGSNDEVGLKRMASILTEDLSAMGLKASYDHHTRSLQAEKRSSNPQAKTILFLAHFDTVYDLHHPFTQVSRLQNSDPRVKAAGSLAPILSGPGVADDKGGIALIFLILEHLKQTAAWNQVNWKILLQADEELGSRFSKKTLEAFAKGSDLALGFEPGWIDSEQRVFIPSKIGGYQKVSIEVTGPEEHPAISNRRGLSPSDAIAEFVGSLGKLRRAGLSVNVFDLHAKGKANMTPFRASLQLAIRYLKVEDLELVERRIRNQRARIEKHFGFSVNLKQIDVWKPHRISSPQIVKRLQAHAKALNLPIPKESVALTRGAASFVSRMGISTLEAMGPFGQNFHSDQEILYLGSAPRRCELALRLIQDQIR